MFNWKTGAGARSGGNVCTNFQFKKFGEGVTGGRYENWKCIAEMTIKKAEQCKINLYSRANKKKEEPKCARQMGRLQEIPFWNGRENRAQRKKGHEILSIRRDDQNTQQLQVKSFPANVSDFSRQLCHQQFPSDASARIYTEVKVWRYIQFFCVQCARFHATAVAVSLSHHSFLPLFIRPFSVLFLFIYCGRTAADCLERRCLIDVLRMWIADGKQRHTSKNFLYRRRWCGIVDHRARAYGIPLDTTINLSIHSLVSCILMPKSKYDRWQQFNFIMYAFSLTHTDTQTHRQ